MAGGGSTAASCTTAPVYAEARLEATLEELQSVQIIGVLATSHYIAEAVISWPTWIMCKCVQNIGCLIVSHDFKIYHVMKI